MSRLALGHGRADRVPDTPFERFGKLAAMGYQIE